MLQSQRFLVTSLKGAVGRLAFMVLLFIWLVASASACGVDASEKSKGHSEADHGKQSRAKDANKPPPADYDGPARPEQGATEVVLRVSGSEGGAYKGWVYTDRQIGPDEVLYHTDKPDFWGVIKAEPTQYRFKLPHGSYKDPTGDWVWNGLNVDLKKATRGGRDWEGELNAKLLVDGKVVSCSGTEPFNSLSVGWSPEKPNGSFIEKLNC